MARTSNSHEFEPVKVKGTLTVSPGIMARVSMFGPQSCCLAVATCTFKIGKRLRFWIVTERGWGGGRVLTHAGSNTMNFAVVWAAPLKEFAVVIATNQAGGETPNACDEAAGAVIRRFLS